MSKSNEKQNEHNKVVEFYNGRTIFMTGAAGFVGVVLLEILLRCCPGIRDIYILLRSKKGVDPQSRTKELFNRTIFNKLKKDNPDALKKVHVIPGDISKPGLGMSIEDTQKIIQEVSIVFHCAASISFLKPLRFLLENNVRATDSIIELCKNLKTCEALVYTSTAYSNCNRKLTIEERIYRLPYPAQRFLELLEKGNDDELMQIASECQPSWPNYYTFSKSISENLIAEKASDIKTAIIRPAVICNVWKGPLPGYAEENSSLAQIFLGFGRGFLRVLEGRDDVHFDLIPVDVIANSHVVAAWHVATNRAQSPHVVNCTSTNAISYKLKEYLSTMQEFLTKETIPNAFREPKTTMWVVKQRFIKELLSIYEHYIPAVFLDLVLLFRGKKPRLVSAYRFLDLATHISKYFILNDWHYDTKNFDGLQDPLDKEDRNTFYTNLEGLTMNTVIETLPEGAPFYDWKQDKMSRTERVKFIKQVYVFTRFIQMMFLFCLMWLLYVITSKILHVINVH